MSQLNRFVLLAILVSLLILVNESTAAGARYGSHHRHGTARPVTGYGANLHRRFVLKQELNRAKLGQPVRNRGNILWYR
jgi:hypothetical protein